MSFYRLLVIFFSIRNTGIFNEIIPGFNPFLKTVFKKKNPALALKICLERLWDCTFFFDASRRPKKYMLKSRPSRDDYLFALGFLVFVIDLRSKIVPHKSIFLNLVLDNEWDILR